MSEATLEAYFRQLMESQRSAHVTVAWQGGEPTMMGFDFSGVEATAIAATLAAMVGAILIAARLLRLGFLANFISLQWPRSR